MRTSSARRPWDHGSLTRQQRGYGAAHDRMRAHLMATVILCEECTRRGRTTVGTIADHKVPKAKGGTDARSNYQLLCAPCDLDKQARDQGNTRRRRPRIAKDGWPVEE